MENFTNLMLSTIADTAPVIWLNCILEIVYATGGVINIFFIEPSVFIVYALAAPVIKPVKQKRTRMGMSNEDKKIISENVPLWLQQVIMGMLLSDGSLRMGGKYALLSIQNIHPELTQALWMMCNKFNLILSGVKPLERKNKQTIYTFQTLTLPFFLQLFNDWYISVGGKNIKVLPPYFEDMFNDLAFAFLIMGDGSFGKSQRTMKLSVNNFTLTEVNRIQAALLSKFDINSKVYSTVKNSDRGHIIYIPAREVSKVRATVYHLILPTLQYKLGL